MTCRDEVLKAARLIITQKGVNEFSIKDILDEMERNQTRYEESTIKTHISSRMCADAPQHHAVKYEDFERIGNGVYRIRNLS